MAEVAGRDVIPMVCAVYPYGLRSLSLWFAQSISMVYATYPYGLRSLSQWVMLFVCSLYCVQAGSLAGKDLRVWNR